MLRVDVVYAIKILKPVKDMFDKLKTAAAENAFTSQRIETIPGDWICTEQDADILVRSYTQFADMIWKLTNNEVIMILKSTNVIFQMVDMCKNIEKIRFYTIDSMWRVMSSLSHRNIFHRIQSQDILLYLTNLIKVDPNAEHMIYGRISKTPNFTSVRSCALILTILSTSREYREYFLSEDVNGMQSLLIWSTLELECMCCMYSRSELIISIIYCMHKHFQEYELRRIQKMELFVLYNKNLNNSLNDDLLFRINNSTFKCDYLSQFVPFCVGVFSTVNVKKNIILVLKFLSGNILYKTKFENSGGYIALCTLKKNEICRLENFQNSYTQNLSAIKESKKILENINIIEKMFDY